MSDLTERADRARRLAQVIEAHVAVDLATVALQRAVAQLEQAVGINHDAARAAHDTLDGCRIALGKVNTLRLRTPWP